MTAGGSTSLLGRLRWALERINVAVAYVSLALVVVVFYLGDFLGDYKNVLLPAALGVVVLYLIRSLQAIEGSLGQKFSGGEETLEQKFSDVEETLEQRFGDVETSLEDVREQQKDWRGLLPLFADAQRAGLQSVCLTADEWVPPPPRAVFAAAGMRIRYMQVSDFREQLTSVLRTGGEVTMVMSDPRSKRVWARYRDEPARFGKRNQMMELAALLGTVHEWCELIAKEGLDTTKFTVKISEEYPLAAYYRVDESIWTYNYPYKFRGLDSPVYQFSVSGPVGNRLCQFLDAVSSTAKPFDDAQYEDIDRWRQDGRLLDRAVLP